MIFKVSHMAFATDDLKWTTTLVEAETKEEALAKFNAVAEKRSGGYYCWNQAKLDHVHIPEIIK